MIMTEAQDSDHDQARDFRMKLRSLTQRLW